MVLVVSGATDEPCRFGAVNEADGTVVAKEEIVSHFTDRRPPRIAMSAYGQEELMLGGREARSLGLLLAPTFEMAHGRCAGRAVARRPHWAGTRFSRYHLATMQFPPCDYVALSPSPCAQFRILRGG